MWLNVIITWLEREIKKKQLTYKRQRYFCRENPSTNLVIHYEDLHSNFEGEIFKLADFLQIERPNSTTTCSLRELTSVNSMKARIEVHNDFKGKGLINKGEMHVWKNEFPAEFVEKFDKLTRETFADDRIFERFI